MISMSIVRMLFTVARTKMGACLDYRVIKEKDFDKMLQIWNKKVEESLSENGGAYSGAIGELGSGCQIQSKQDSVDKAVDFITEKHKKWSKAMCVPFPEGFVVGGWCSS